MKVISIVGKKRSGKDSVAEIILDESFSVKYALANKIKSTLADVYYDHNYVNKTGQDLFLSHFNGIDYDREQVLMLSNFDVADIMIKCVDQLCEKSNLSSDYDLSTASKAISTIMKNDQPWSVRRLMQTLGTDIVVNNIDEYFWLKCMVNEYFKCKSEGYDYFVITDIRQQTEIDFARLLGQVIFIERPSINNCNKDKHISEAGLARQEGEILVTNDGTLADLKQTILEVI